MPDPPIDYQTALRVRCRYCGAHIGEPCVNAISNTPLHIYIAHPQRITDVRRALPPEELEPDPEELF